MRTFIALVCICVVVLSCGCLSSEDEHLTTMTLKEVINDYKKNWNDSTKVYSYWLESLNDGDTLVIKDTLKDIFYQEDENFTLIHFESSANTSFGIEGDITNNFDNGDVVTLTTHIIEVSFKEEDQQTGQVWTVRLETFEEGWDNKNHTALPFPRSCISHYS